MTDEREPKTTEQTTVELPPRMSAPTPPPRVSAPRRPGLSTGPWNERYELRSEIGSGGMGVVYEAFDDTLGRRVALKVVAPGHAPELQRRLLSEAKALAKLSHPNVVTIYDAGEHYGQVFLSMELVQGQTLRRWYAQAPTGHRAIVGQFLAAGRGLAAAHAAGIVHRDFKPENVLVGDDGRVVVTDFGLARPVTAGPDDALPPAPITDDPRTLPSAGTPAYMSPEQLDGRPLDARSDQFSFCVALHEGLHGVRPWSGRNPKELLAQMQSGTRATLPKPNLLPFWLSSVIERGLSFDPDARFPSMGALLSELEQGLRPSRLRWAALAGAVVALAAGTTLHFATRPRCDGAPQKVDAVWNDGRRDALAKGFAKSGRDGAFQLALAVTRAMKEFSTQWSAAHKDACESTRVRGEHSEAVLDRRVACLDRRLAEADALLTLFATADAQVLERASVAAASLRDLSECSDVGALLEQPTERPADEATRAVYDGHVKALAEVRALSLTGRFADADAKGQTLVASLVGTPWPALHAEALFELGQVQRRRGAQKQAAATLESAVVEAEAAGARAISARAWLEQVNVAIDYDDHAEASRAARHGAAIASRVTPTSSLVYHRVNALSRLEAALEHMPEAIRLVDDGLAELAKRDGADSLHVALLLNHKGLFLQRQGKYDEAYATLERALPLFERHQGDPSPGAATALQVLGQIDLREGRVGKALERQERSLDIRRRIYGEMHVHVAASEGEVGYVLLATDRVNEAQSMFDHSIVIAEAKQKRLILAAADLALASLAFRRGDWGLTVAKATRAHGMFLNLEPKAPEVSRAKMLEAAALGEIGARAQAQAMLEGVIATLGGTVGEEHPTLVEPWWRLSEQQSARKDFAAAKASAERALVLAQRTPGNAALLAEVKFAQAQAETDPARARALATEAMETLRSVPAPLRAARIERWLAAR